MNIPVPVAVTLITLMSFHFSITRTNSVWWQVKRMLKLLKNNEETLLDGFQKNIFLPIMRKSMEKGKIASELRNKGFTTEVGEDGVYVRLNRKLTKREIEFALDFDIDQEQLIRIAPETIFVPSW